MVSPERGTETLLEQRETTMASPRISFSAEFLDDDSFISLSPRSSLDEEIERQLATAKKKNIVGEFEFLSSKNSFDGTAVQTMVTADELFSGGKLLPYRQINHATDKLAKINLKSDHHQDQTSKDDQHIPDNKGNGNVLFLGREQPEPRIWFVDDDPSPRPPKCTVLWKELLRLKKQKGSNLSPSSSSSSSSSSLSTSSLGDKEKDDRNKSGKEKDTKRTKKVLERTRSASSIRIRPMVNVPICTQGKGSSLPPLFPLRKSKIGR